MPASSSVQAKLDAKFGRRKNARVGGKGSVRRKKKVTRKTTNSEDKKLQTQLKKLNVNGIPAIEEVNLFQEDGKVIHFQNPRVQASIAANTYVVSGQADHKNLTDLLPNILTQLGSESLSHLKDAVSQINPQEAQDEEDDEEDGIPELVEEINFEEISNKKPAAETVETEETEVEEMQEVS